MSKVFLSHSSFDKERVGSIYSKLVTRLGKESVIMDSFNFEEGRETIKEIKEHIENSNLFVFFISDASLKSNWVQQELDLAYKKLSKDDTYQICPIIIDKKIKYDNVLIPDWMSEKYNIQNIPSNKKIITIIEERMTEISQDKSSTIRNRQNLFVGRNAFLKDIEERLDDFRLAKPIALIASGLQGVGRRTLLKKSLIKANIVKSTYPFSEIVTERNDSIEDFILKLYDLGFLDDTDKLFEPHKLNEFSQDKKMDILIELIVSLQERNVFIVVNDYGCIISHRGELSDWFKESLKSGKIKSQLLLLISSKFRYLSGKDYNFHEVFSLNVPELDISERRGLLNRYSQNTLDRQLDSEKLEFISDLLTGLPEQIFYAVDRLKTIGWNSFRSDTFSIVQFNTQKAEILLSDFKESSELEFLALLCQFDSIGEDYILKVVSNGDSSKTQFYKTMLDKFMLRGICEYVGVLQEYIRVNDSIRDFIIRSEYSYNKEHGQILLEQVKEFVNNISENESEDYNVPEYLFSLKHSLLHGIALPEQLIFPSIYLKTMNDLYNSGKLQEVVDFADKALERKDTYAEHMIFEIRYLLCSALAKQCKQLNQSYKSKERFKKEVQFINGADHNFLFGFFYRQIGEFDKALDRLNEALKERKNFSKANREKVQVLISMQDFPAALELSKSNYESYPTNPYHIQAYFNCLIKSDVSDKDKILKDLIDVMERIQNNLSGELYPRMKAQYDAYVKNDYSSAISNIDIAISKNPDIQYARIIKFEIAERFSDIQVMEEIINFFEDNELRHRYHNNFVCMNAIMKLYNFGLDNAKDYFNKNIKNYTPQAKERFVNRLERTKNNNL